jgi:predicted RNA-binding protein with PUA-like domain
MQVARAAYPDPTASDAEHPLYDAKQHVETAKAKSKAKATAKVEVTSGVEAKDKAAGGNAASAAGIVARWWAIDLEAVRELPSPVLLPALKARPELGEMALLKQPRLSVQPVAAAEWATILSMAEEVGSGNRDALNGAVNKAKEGLNEEKGRSTKKRTRSGVRKEN